MAKTSKPLSCKTGLAPGVLIPIGLQPVEMVKVNHYMFDNQNLIIQSYDKHNFNLIFPLNPSKQHWINIMGLDVEIVNKIGQELNIHNLILEDILNSHLRPKYENLEQYCFLALKEFKSENDNQITTYPLNLVMGPNYVISFSAIEKSVFSSLLPRLENPNGKLRCRGSDYLFFALADIIVDSYFPLLEKGNDLIENMEDQLDNHPNEDITAQMQDLKKQFLKSRRNIFPLKEAYSFILNEDSKLFREENQKYFRDTQDHILFALDQIDYLKEHLNSLFASYQNYMDNQLNKIMKILTLIATLFIPLTFFAGIYGMNFEYMPELKWKYGYFFLLGLMLVITLIMIWFFRKKKWL